MKLTNTFFFAVIALLALPGLSLAQITYEPLVGIPGLTGSTDMNVFFNTLYALSISIAAILAVIKVIVAGVKYMLTDVVTSKADAIRDIQGALIGLIIVVGAWVILTVINPQITGGGPAPTRLTVTPPAGPTVTPPTPTERALAAIGPGAQVRSYVCANPADCATRQADCVSDSGVVVPTGPDRFTCVTPPPSQPDILTAGNEAVAAALAAGNINSTLERLEIRPAAEAGMSAGQQIEEFRTRCEATAPTGLGGRYCTIYPGADDCADEGQGSPVHLCVN